MSADLNEHVSENDRASMRRGAGCTNEPVGMTDRVSMIVKEHVNINDRASMSVSASI